MENTISKENTNSKAFSGLLPNAIHKQARQNEREDGDQSKKESSTKTQARRQSI